jgi:cytochrome c oxidase cbb3-type subunit 4
MQLVLIEAISTIAAMGAFVAVVAWAYSKKQTKAFQQASRLPFTDDESERVND